MATQDEVARLAGTSTAVVSYVINDGPRNVSEATRKKVLDAVAKLAYRPNAVARSLRSASSRVLGLIAADITNPYCGQLAVAVEDSALARGRTLLFGNAKHDDDRQARHLRTFLEQRVEGIIFIGSAYTDERFLPATTAVLHDNDVPLVMLDRPGQQIGATTIQVDNRGGAYAATLHLIQHGHRRVASFAGSFGLSSMRERQEGWEAALEATGINPDKVVKAQSDIGRYQAYEVAREMLSRSDRPTAVFAHTDEQAVGILYAAASAGLRVGEDLAVASFDGLAESRIISPALTTVEQPMTSRAELAVGALLGDQDGNPVEVPEGPLPVRLVVRESCGCHGGPKAI